MSDKPEVKKVLDEFDQQYRYRAKRERGGETC